MSTRSVMKNRIADELARSDLTSQTVYAITDAIERYQPDRFYFNESRLVTFDTVNGTEFYTTLTGDVSHIRDVYDIDYVTITIGGVVTTLDWLDPLEAELDSDGGAWTGQPHSYTVFDNKVRLVPVPNNAWTVRIAGHIKRAAPVSDDEANNVWMVEAERLIRARAKYNLALDVLRDTELAQTMAAAVTEAYDQLKGHTALQVGTGRIRSSDW